jgi:hypothetical protein
MCLSWMIGFVHGELERIRVLNQFVACPGREDVDIENHPLWTETFPVDV